MSDDLSIPRPTYRVPNRGSRGRMDPVFRRLLLFAGALAGVGALVGGVSMLFNHHAGPVPVIQADSRPIKVKPENPGGMKIAGLGDDSNAVTADTGTLAPPPEVPDPKALRAAPASAATPAPVAGPVPLVMRSPAAPPAAARPVAPPLSAPPLAAPVAQAVAPPPVRADPKPVAAPSAAPHDAAHATAVQLAALPTEEAARAEWQSMARRMPEILRGRAPAYSKVERDGHLYWRVRVVGFGDMAQARTFCERVRARNASCSVADF